MRDLPERSSPHPTAQYLDGVHSINLYNQRKRIIYTSYFSRCRWHPTKKPHRSFMSHVAEQRSMLSGLAFSPCVPHSNLSSSRFDVVLASCSGSFVLLLFVVEAQRTIQWLCRFHGCRSSTHLWIILFMPIISSDWCQSHTSFFWIIAKRPLELHFPIGIDNKKRNNHNRTVKEQRSTWTARICSARIFSSSTIRPRNCYLLVDGHILRCQRMSGLAKGRSWEHITSALRASTSLFSFQLSWRSTLQSRLMPTTTMTSQNAFVGYQRHLVSQSSLLYPSSAAMTL